MTSNSSNSDKLSANDKSKTDLLSKFLNWFIVSLIVIFVLLILGIDYYIKRKELDPSSSKSPFNSDSSSVKK